jgi:hypothetical protein
MLNVANKPSMLSVIMLNFVMLNVMASHKVAHYPNFADLYYLEPGIIIVLVITVTSPACKNWLVFV